MILKKISTTPCYGITYEITNEKGAKSYLMGTIHIADKDMVQNTPYLNLIDRCSALYTEMGTDIYITLPHSSIPEQPHKYSHVGYRFIIDHALVIAAWCKGIPITRLDTLSEENLDLYLNEELNDESLEEMKDVSPYFKTIIARKSGNIQKINDNRVKAQKIASASVVEREQKWAEVLPLH